MHLTRKAALLTVIATMGLSAHTATTASAMSAPPREPGTPVTQTRIHAAMDSTDGPPPAGLTPGSRPRALSRPKFPAAVAGPDAARASNASVREVLGFAQSGEVSSGSWKADLRFDLLTTIAYFGVNLNGDGSMVTSDAGYTTWRSQALTDLVNAAHAAGDRVVLTVKAFDDSTIASVTGSETNRQAAIANIISEVSSRSADGVNVDFEGSGSSSASGFTQFIGELRGALNAHLPGAAYLTVDTYASAASGGTLYNLPQLSPNVDAFDVMAYDITSPGSANAGPVAPLSGMTYADANTVAAYLSEVPAAKVILGVPYYGYKWSVTQPTAQAPTTGSATADTYSDVQADLACATQLTQHWDSTFATPWATWWSPATNDPCAGNHNSWRELYYDNATSLGDKYDLVTSQNLRGIGIWSLGYDSGHQELWDEIALKLTVPTPLVTPLPSSESATSFDVSWSMPADSPPVAYYAVFAQQAGGPWVLWANVANAKDVTFFGSPGKQYGFWVEAFTADWRSSGGPGPAAATTTVSNSAHSPMPFTALDAVDGYGALHPASSPLLSPTASWPGWDIARGLVFDSTGEGGAVVDGWGGLHTLGDATSVTGTASWPGWDIVRGIATTPGNTAGWVLDGWGGLHGFAFGGAAVPAVPTSYSYWRGWDIARAVATFSDGSGGLVLDGWGGLHPFQTGGGTAAAATVSGYWRGWDIARSVVLLPGSTAASYAGYVLDGWGGLHAFASGTRALPPPISDGAYRSGADVARGVVLLPGSTSSGYVVDNEGGFYPFGGAPAVVTPNYGADGTTSRSVTID